MNDYFTEIREGEIVAAALSFLLWPAAAVTDIVTKVSTMTPIATFTTFAIVGGRNVFNDFGAFTRGFGAAGVIFVIGTFTERKIIESRLAAEDEKIEETLESRATAFGQTRAGKSFKDFCSSTQTGQAQFIQKMVCALNLSSIGIPK